MTREEFKMWALARGWTEDKFGHLHKTMKSKDQTERKYRYKIGRYSVRREVQVVHEASQYSPRSTSWVRLKSGYFKNLSIDAEGKLHGLSVNGCGEPLRNPEAS